MANPVRGKYKIGSIFPQKKSCKKVFISWSGEYTEKFSRALKKELEDKIFENCNLKCFVSTDDIECGSDWRNKVHSELHECGLGIICITKENVRAPWLYLEAGAMIDRGIYTIPLLLNCDASILKNTPFEGLQATSFHQEDEFRKMLEVINKQLDLGVTKAYIHKHYKPVHSELKRRLSDVFKKLKNLRVFNEAYVYPQNITTFNSKTVYISAPMASVGDDEYQKINQCVCDISDSLQNIGFKRVYSPVIKKSCAEDFDGPAKAIKDNFSQLKQIECIVVIYPQKVPSSALVEIGYGIALCKKMVVFYREGVPYLLQDTNGIPHVRTYPFKDYDDIKKIIEMNEMALFE